MGPLELAGLGAVPGVMYVELGSGAAMVGRVCTWVLWSCRTILGRVSALWKEG